LLNQEATELIHSGRSSLPLTNGFDGFYVVDPNFPETTVGFPEHGYRQWIEDAGLLLEPPIHYGSWCGRGTALSYQDIVILKPRV
jgi:hypothetical protein